MASFFEAFFFVGAMLAKSECRVGELPGVGKRQMRAGGRGEGNLLVFDVDEGRKSKRERSRINSQNRLRNDCLILESKLKKK